MNKRVPIRPGVGTDSDRYVSLQSAIDAAYDLPDGHIHEGPIDPSTGYPSYYDVDDGHAGREFTDDTTMTYPITIQRYTGKPFSPHTFFADGLEDVGEGVLTTNHSQSSYGHPVLLVDGRAYGSADIPSDWALCPSPTLLGRHDASTPRHRAVRAALDNFLAPKEAAR